MMKILDHYIDQLLDKSTPQAPVWNIEKINPLHGSRGNRSLTHLLQQE